MSTNNKKSPRPFGLRFLEEVPEDRLANVAGGKTRRRPIVTTEHVSLPQPAFPRGDHG
jgi:hypothetical protein